MRRPRFTQHQRIVVAVTDSEASLQATGVAAQLVPQRGELVFVHVIEVPLEFPLDQPPPDGERQHKAAAHDLLGRCQALAERYGVSSKRVIERQHIAGPAIVEAAERHRAGLIVIAGRQRFSHSGRVRLGATASYVLKHAQCRVMVISTQTEQVASALKVA